MSNERDLEVTKKKAIKEGIFRRIRVIERKNKIWMITLFLANFFFASDIMAVNKSKEGPSSIHIKPDSDRSQITYDALKTAGENFVGFLRKTGQSEIPVTQDELKIFSRQCKKVVNGKVLFTSVRAYPDQINDARRAIGKWTLQTLWSTASPEDKSYTVAFKGKSEKMPEFITMATIFVDQTGKINEIQEVYNLYDQKKLSIQSN